MNALLFLLKIVFTYWSGAPAFSGALKTAQERKTMDLISGSYSIGHNLNHLEWCPKYRYNMFRREDHKNLCEQILWEIAQRHHITITELSVMPDHIHVVVELPTTMSVSQAFHLSKGASSHELFKQKPGFRRRYPKGHFWSPGKFYRSVGDADAETVIQYVRGHRLEQTTLNGFSSTTKGA